MKCLRMAGVAVIFLTNLAAGVEIHGKVPAVPHFLFDPKVKLDVHDNHPLFKDLADSQMGAAAQNFQTAVSGMLKQGPVIAIRGANDISIIPKDLNANAVLLPLNKQGVPLDPQTQSKAIRMTVGLAAQLRGDLTNGRYDLAHQRLSAFDGSGQSSGNPESVFAEQGPSELARHPADEYLHWLITHSQADLRQKIDIALSEKTIPTLQEVIGILKAANKTDKIVFKTGDSSISNYRRHFQLAITALESGELESAANHLRQARSYIYQFQNMGTVDKDAEGGGLEIDPRTGKAIIKDKNGRIIGSQG